MENNNGSPKPIRCRAAVSRAAGEPLVMEEVEVAPPKAWEVRIKIICTSLCHSDVTFWKMKEPDGVFPRIFGHEAVGLKPGTLTLSSARVVESVGEHVEDIQVGDMVVPTFLAQCKECEDCKSEKSNICSRFPFRLVGMPRDGTSRFKGANSGEEVHNFVSVSSFAEYTVVDVVQLTKVDPSLPPEKACLLGCGVSTGVGSAWKVAAVEAGSTVAIFGLGTIGLAVAEGARLRGAARIIGVDLNPDKFEMGKKFGLTDFVNPQEIGEKSVSQVIIEMTNGGADYCFECIGLASLMTEAFSSSRKGWGKTIIIGYEMHGSPLSIDAIQILQGKCVMGSFFGGIKAKTDIPILAQQYLNKELHLDEFITHEVDFKDINKAFDLLLQGKSLRCVIWMDRCEETRSFM